jgi:integrase
VPGVGKHRIDRLEPEHLESLYRRMQKNGSKAGTAHQAHRTIRTALGEAVRRGHAAKNAAALAKPPRLEEDEAEVEPYSLEEVQRLLLEVNKRRNSARWMLALTLGLRQGETLGLRWSDVDLDNEYLKLRRNRLRPRYKHGCAEASPCGRTAAGYCPDRVQVRRETKNTKSRAGRRAVPLPGPLVAMLRSHAAAQAREREAAGNLWAESDYVFTKPLGGPLSPNTDYHDWKRLLEDARVRDGRLHDARHTAATVLMLLGVPDRVIDQIMGWEPGTSARMRARYLHVPDAMLKDVARKIADAIWGPPETPSVDKNQDNEGQAA